MVKAIGIITLSLALLFGAVHILEHTFYRNVTRSETLGYYIAVPLLPIRRGDLVLTCLSNKSYKQVLSNLGLKDVTGECKDGMPYLLKRVAAISGDEVQVSSHGIVINGILQKNSKQYKKGRGIALYPLPIGYIHKLKTHEYFMLGETTHSVDSRYFGIIKQADIYRRAFLIYER